jgi:peptide chain release factor 3
MLQFEVVASRLMNEYSVDAVFEGTSINTARWVSCDDKKMLADFERSSAGAHLAHDAAGNLAYLASSAVNLKLVQERWPGVTFHATREHAVRIA